MDKEFEKKLEESIKACKINLIEDIQDSIRNIHIDFEILTQNIKKIIEENKGKS